MSYDAYDPRLETLVMETITHFDPEIAKLPEQDRARLSNELHASPQLASKIHYERMHTGFTREITVTLKDVERLYEAKISAQ